MYVSNVYIYIYIYIHIYIYVIQIVEVTWLMESH